MSSPAALVTGSSGFIGRNFTRYLRENGWLVLGIDSADNADARDFFRARDPWSLRFYDLVIHAAAVVGGRRVIENDPLAQAVNLELDAGLFRWARAARPGRVIYFSSSAAYPVRLQGETGHRQLAEADIILPDGGGAIGPPDSLYGWTKLTGEYLAHLARQDGVAVTVVRPFSGYGSDQDESYPFGAFAGRAARREDPFLIWGDGKQARDFIHISDITAAVMELYRQDVNGPVNLGTGTAVTMNGLAALFAAQAGYAPAFEHVPAAPSGVRWRVADAVRMNQVRRPATGLEHGVWLALEHRKRAAP